jgi:hypothetical protein
VSLSFAALAQPTLRRALDWNGERVEYLFRPGAHTAAFEARLQDAQKAGEPLAFAALLAELVTWIDVVDEHGSHLPCTGETFGSLPVQFLGALWLSIGEAMRPDPPKGGTSDAG